MTAIQVGSQKLLLATKNLFSGPPCNSKPTNSLGLLRGNYIIIYFKTEAWSDKYKICYQILSYQIFFLSFFLVRETRTYKKIAQKFSWLAK